MRVGTYILPEIPVRVKKETTAWIPVFDESLSSSNFALAVRLHYPTFLGAWLVRNYESWKPRNRIHGWAVKHFLRKTGVWMEYRWLRDTPSLRCQSQKESYD